jgi:phytoene dehydrogenase-like protein
VDRTEIILNQIERFAPNFRDTILAYVPSNTSTLAHWNPNLIGGDVSGGAMTLSQLLFRPTPRGYRTSNPSIYLCSSSTPPGGGVHGMCGNLAALAALRDHAPRS